MPRNRTIPSALIAIMCCAVALVGGVVAQRALWHAEVRTDVDAPTVQHEVAAHLEDLDEADRLAASSASIDADAFASHLPVVSIETHGQDIPGDVVTDENGETRYRADGTRVTTTAWDGSADIIATVRVYDNDGKANRLDDDPVLTESTRLHYRGYSSRTFPKRNYSLHLVNDKGEAIDREVMGMPADNAWILNGPYLDKSLIRNYLAYNVFGSFCAYTPEVRFCELFVDGAYRGLFLCMESIDVNPNRLDLTERDDAVSVLQTSGAATSYLLQLDRYDTEDVVLDDLSSRVGLQDSTLSVVYPAAEDLSEDERLWIRDDISAIEKSLYSYDYDTAAYGYTTTTDIDSFVAYFIANEFSMNYDAGVYSTYLYKDLRGALSIGPIWDFNSAFDAYVEDDYSTASGFEMVNRPWFTMMVKDETFTEAVIARYRELRAGVLSDENLQSFIDEALDYLGPAIERNWEIWGSTFDPETLDPQHRLTPIERNPRSYDEAVDDLRAFITRRGAWLDAHIENLRQFSHESAVKMDNH